MKKTILALFCVLFFSSPAHANIIPEQINYTNGTSFLRLTNLYNTSVLCYIEDEINYHYFVVYPKNTSKYVPVYGKYHWYCEFS